MSRVLASAGELIQVSSEIPWLETLLEEAADGRAVPAAAVRGDPSVVLQVESSRKPFPIPAAEFLARGVLRTGATVVLIDACASGMDLAVEWADDVLHVRARHRPSRQERFAALALPTRFRLLLREVLLQYPVLWRAGVRGRAPLHASVYRRHADLDGTVILVGGPSGVGKSTLVQRELRLGGEATCDNLCVSDGVRAWGVVEPVRLPAGGAGRRVTHGRREARLGRRVDELTPDLLVLLRRDGRLAAAPTNPVAVEAAVRSLVAGTFMAGELRRYWGFAATLALATGEGPSAPPVAAVARMLAERLPSCEIVLPDEAPAERGSGVAELLPPIRTEATS